MKSQLPGTEGYDSPESEARNAFALFMGERPQGKKNTPMSLTLDPLDPRGLGIGGQKGIVEQM
jgi:hypothetical protein